MWHHPSPPHTAVGAAVRIPSQTFPPLVFGRPTPKWTAEKEAGSEAQSKGCSASPLSTEPLPWHQGPREPGPKPGHSRKQNSGKYQSRDSCSLGFRVQMPPGPSRVSPNSRSGSWLPRLSRASSLVRWEGTKDKPSSLREKGCPLASLCAEGFVRGFRAQYAIGYRHFVVGCTLWRGAVSSPWCSWSGCWRQAWNPLPAKNGCPLGEQGQRELSGPWSYRRSGIKAEGKRVREAACARGFGPFWLTSEALAVLKASCLVGWERSPERGEP